MQLSILAKTPVGPFQELTLNFPTEPGVYVLKGRNAAGKTYLLEHVLPRVGGESVEVAPMDGHERGEVSLTEDGQTFTLRVGKRVTSEGSLPIYFPREEGRALAELVKPTAKDEGARELARIQALCRLARLEPTPARMQVLGGQDVPLRPGATIVDAAKETRKRLQEQAREAEACQQRAAGEVSALTRHLADIQPLEPVDVAIPVEDAQAEATRLERDAAVIRARADQRQQAEQRLEKIRAGRADRPDCRDIDERISGLTIARDEAAAKIADLERTLADLRQAQAARLADLRASTDERTRLDRAAEQWDREQAELEQPLDGPTPAEADEAEMAALQARSELEAARAYAAFCAAEERQSQDRTRLEAEREAAVQQQMAAEQRAADLRQAAGQVWERLAGLLADSGLEDFVVQDGLLSVRLENGRIEPYNDSRLSFGQLVFFALRAAFAAIEGAQKGKTVFLIPWDFWWSLDPDHQQEVWTQSLIVGIALYTEAPSSGDIRVEAWEG